MSLETHPFGSSRKRWKDNIKIDLEEINCENLSCMELAVDRDKRQALVKTVLNLRILPPRAGYLIG
jgi:hypothetical protein